jgi:hypothetical protein
MCRIIRFCKQRGKCDCGPVLLLNLDKWRDRKVTYRDIKFYKKIANFGKGGISAYSLSQVLGKDDYIHTYAQVSKYLKNDGAVVFFDGDHVFLGLCDTAGNYRVINRSCVGPTDKKISHQKLQSIVKKCSSWLVNK